MTNKIEWYWTEKYSEKVQGPFDSGEKALQDAKEKLEKGSVVEIGKVKRIEPGCYLPNTENIIEDMDEVALHQDFGWVDDGDIIKAKEGAVDALRVFLLNWSKEYLSIDRWLTDSSTAETVILD